MTAKDFTVLMIRLVLGFIFFSSGMNKLANGEFGHLIGPPYLIEDLAAYGLRGFAYMIAVSQVVAGALVLSQRFSLIGLIILVPMNAGILGVTLSQQWTGTPVVNAFLIILNVAALLYERGLVNVCLGIRTTERTRSIAAELYPQTLYGIIILLLAVAGASLAPWFPIAAKLISGVMFIFIGLIIFRKDLLKSSKPVLQILDRTVLISYFIFITCIVFAGELHNLVPFAVQGVFIALLAGFLAYLTGIVIRVRGARP